MIHISFNLSQQTLTLSLDLPIARQDSRLAEGKTHLPERKVTASVPDSAQSRTSTFKTGSLYSYRTMDGYGFIEASDGEIFLCIDRRSKMQRLESI